MAVKPQGIQISLTNRCNLRCLHCDIWKGQNGQELTLREWLKVIKQLKKWLGPFRLDISGGEPFLRKDLLEIIKFCNRNNIQQVITTNATLMNERIIKFLSRIDNLTLNMSLDGATPQVHDFLRGREGVFKKVLEALRRFKSLPGRRCLITVATILMGYNVGRIPDIIKLAMEEKLADGINFQALDNNFHANYEHGWHRKNIFWPSEDDKGQIASAIEEIISHKKRGLPIYNSLRQLEYFKDYFAGTRLAEALSCVTGEANFIINPSGKGLLCWNKAPVGDVTSEDIEGIWNSALSAQRRDEIKRCSRTCRILNCNFNS